MRSLLEGQPPVFRATALFLLAVICGLAFVRLVHGERSADIIVIAIAAAGAGRVFLRSNRKR